jgi:hypothetical protein
MKNEHNLEVLTNFCLQGMVNIKTLTFHPKQVVVMIMIMHTD